MRGFMPVCELHFKNPKKWGEDGKTFTGSAFIKNDPEWDRDNPERPIKKRPLGPSISEMSDWPGGLEAYGQGPVNVR